MPYQTSVSFYPSVSLPGQPYKNHVGGNHEIVTVTSDEFLAPGCAVIATESISHGRFKVEKATAANFNIQRLLFIDRSQLEANNPYEGTPLTQLNPTSNATYLYTPNTAIPAYRAGQFYCVVEKEIDPLNPVFLRVANADVASPQLEGVGFLTDVADGADTIDISSDVFWITEDDISTQLRRDPSTNAQQERDRILLREGFGIAAIAFKN